MKPNLLHFWIKRMTYAGLVIALAVAGVSRVTAQELTGAWSGFIL